VAALRDRFDLDPGAEVTLEANPEDWSHGLGAALVESGFDRVSFGAQSFDEATLRFMGRRHDAGAIEAAVGAARSVGFRSISVDLIYGSPGEDRATWEQTIERAVALGTPHVSCYALTVERGTPLGRAVAGGAPAPDPDLQADEYELAHAALEAAGLGRYEVSNWAVAGHECRYNLAVWAQGEYEAFGNGAHGFRHGRRFRNVRRLDAYLERIESGRSPRAGMETLAGWEAEVDRLFVGLRRSAGVAEGGGVRAFLASTEGRRLLDAGVVAFDGRLRVVDPLLTDEVERVVLGLAPISPG
jgi:coproporphyrinogen III oxidase-like Fe-S oxidoreductase